MNHILQDSNKLNEAMIAIQNKGKSSVDIIEFFLAKSDDEQRQICQSVNSVDEFADLIIAEYEKTQTATSATQTSADSSAQTQDVTQTQQNPAQATPQDFSRVAVTSFTIDGVPENASTTTQGADSVDSTNASAIDTQAPQEATQTQDAPAENTQTPADSAENNAQTTQTQDETQTEASADSESTHTQNESEAKTTNETEQTQDETLAAENADTENTEAQAEADSENTPIENAQAQPLSDVEILESIKEFSNADTDLENELLDYFFNQIDDDKRDELKALDSENFTQNLNELYQKYKDELNEIRKPPFNPEAVAERIKLERKAIQDEIERALRENGSVLENTHFILRGTQFLIDSTKEVHQSYLDSMVKINTSGEQLKQAKEELKQEISNFNIKVQENTNALEIYKNQAHGILAKMQVVKESIEQIKQYADDSIEKAGLSAKRCQDLLDELKDEINQFNVIKIKVQQELDVLESLEANRDLYIQIGQDLKALTNAFNTLYNSSIEDLKILKDRLAAQLEQLKNDFVAQLVTHKDALSTELQTQKDEHSQDLQAMIDEILERHNQLRDDWVEKQANLDSANDNIAAFNLQYRHDFAAFETLRDESTQSLQNFKDEKQNELQNNTLAHTKTLQDLTIAHINEIINGAQLTKTKTFDELEQKRDLTNQEAANFLAIKSNELTNLYEQHKESLKTQHDDQSFDSKFKYDEYLRNLDSAAAGEIALLKDDLNKLIASRSTYGSNHIRYTYTSNNTFTMPAGLSAVYVFVQGGTGNGRPTSFGNFLTAAGGTGGGAQRGLCASGFVELLERQRVNVVVGGGGICIVSAAQNLTPAQLEATKIKRQKEIALWQIVGERKAQSYDELKNAFNALSNTRKAQIEAMSPLDYANAILTHLKEQQKAARLAEIESKFNEAQTQNPNANDAKDFVNNLDDEAKKAFETLSADEYVNQAIVMYEQHLAQVAAQNRANAIEARYTELENSGVDIEKLKAFAQNLNDNEKQRLANLEAAASVDEIHRLYDDFTNEPRSDDEFLRELGFFASKDLSNSTTQDTLREYYTNLSTQERKVYDAMPADIAAYEIYKAYRQNAVNFESVDNNIDRFKPILANPATTDFSEYNAFLDSLSDGDKKLYIERIYMQQRDIINASDVKPEQNFEAFSKIPAYDDFKKLNVFKNALEQRLNANNQGGGLIDAFAAMTNGNNPISQRVIPNDPNQNQP